jgi:replicative superfamily II helicase
MKPIEIINAEQAKLKEAINEAVQSFEEATGLKINWAEYSLTETKTRVNIFYSSRIKITYISDGIEVFYP